MDTKNLIEERVMHKSFGAGVIKNTDGRYLEIFFQDRNRWSKFAYPSCFDVFLRLENEEKRKAVAQEVEQWRIDSGADQREKWKQEYEKTQQAMRARLTAAEERKKRAGQRAMELRSSYNRVKTEDNSRETLHREEEGKK